MSNVSVNVTVKAVLDTDGNVVCDVGCENQSATVVFTGTEVLVQVPEPAQESQ